MSNAMIAEVIQRMENLPYDLQHQALNFIKSLSPSLHQGVPGKALLPFAGIIPADELQLMNEAIERDCKQVDLNEW